MGVDVNCCIGGFVRGDIWLLVCWMVIFVFLEWSGGFGWREELIMSIIVGKG